MPVRGRVLGPECLSAILGPDAPPPDASPARRKPSLVLSGAGFVLALAATILPWSRFGLGSGPFGAWGWTLRWSLLSACASAVGLALWLFLNAVRLHPSRRAASVFRVLAALTVAGAILSLVNPPPFVTPAAGPWAAIAAGLLAFAGTFKTRPVLAEHSAQALRS
ncbi:MAG: hypothetical protein WD050_05055 [Actinomycetota bacterium]